MWYSTTNSTYGNHKSFIKNPTGSQLMSQSTVHKTGPAIQNTSSQLSSSNVPNAPVPTNPPHSFIHKGNTMTQSVVPQSSGQRFGGSKLQSTLSYIPNQVQRQLSTVFDDKPEGLHNLRNTCYMNSVLQVLFQIIDFPLNLNTGPVTRAYVKLLHSHSKQDSITFKEELEKRLDFLRGYDQQDAQEFLRSLLELLNQQNNRNSYKTAKPFKFTVNPKLKVSDNWLAFITEMRQHDNSDIVDLFGGETLTDVQCNKGHSRYTFDRFMDLSLSFPSVDRSYSIGDLLKWELRQEPIDDLECQICKGKRPSIKSTYLYNTPPILVLHINRFWQGRTSNSKITTPVEFDEFLQIPYQCVHDDIKKLVPPRYQLIGVVNHFGIIDSGHYVSDVKGAHGQGKWYECNDEQVKEANIKKQGNVSEWAYMLFYKRMTH